MSASLDFAILAALAWALLVLPISSPAENAPRFDGPAELPRVYIQSELKNTPSPLGRTHPPVQTMSALQASVDKAECGEIIEVQGGAVLSGTLMLPAKPCDDNHWITLRTSASDSSLPPEGTRLTPCYAGVASLPDRPPLNCASTKSSTVKLVGLPPLSSKEQVHHYRFIGIEFTQPPGSNAYTLLSLEGNPHHIVIDRCWIHGNPTGNTQRGVLLNGSYLAVIDSTITDIHQVGNDSQGMLAWTGAGPLKLVNNFVEGGASSIGFGGAGSTVVPRDIEIRRNHLFKPTSWRVGSPDFIGVIFNCKVSFESKNSSRVLLEGNILENTWGEHQQGGDGGAVWLGPKNQANACPICEVDDITFRFNIIRHAGAGIYIFDAPSDVGGIAQQAKRYSIHDNLFQDISDAFSGSGTGRGILFRLAGNPHFPPPRDIVIQHNTGLESGANSGLLLLDTSPEVPLVNFTFKDNLVAHGKYGILGCKGRYGKAVLEGCTQNSAFINNVIVGAADSYPESNKSLHSKVSLYPSDLRALKLASADYRLCGGKSVPKPNCDGPSPYLNAATDHKDIGADIEAVSSATRGVE